MPDTQTERPWFIPTEEEMRERDRILSASYFLVRQDGPLGERMRCRRCGGKHAYFTLMCVEQPFCGLSQGLWLIWRKTNEAMTDAVAAGQLTEPQKRIYQTITKGLPDFGKANEQTVRGWLESAEPEVDMGALALGSMEPITQQKAKSLIWRINARGCRPPLTLPGIRGGI